MFLKDEVIHKVQLFNFYHRHILSLRLWLLAAIIVSLLGPEISKFGDMGDGTGIS